MMNGYNMNNIRPGQVPLHAAGTLGTSFSRTSGH